MAMSEYKSGTAFTGVIGRTYDTSSPAWPQPLASKAGAPNVLFIVLDDVGFGQLGCFGGPCETPTWIAWQEMACGTTTCTPRRSVRRRAHAS